MMQLSRKQHSVFYGWWIVGAGFLIWLLTGGFFVLGFTAFFEPIVDDFGWSYTQISLAVSFRGVEVGLFAPLVGFIVDRWGPRRLVFIGILLTGLSYFFISRITSLGMLYGGFALLAIAGSCNSPTAIFTTIANWFRKRLGIATAVAGSGFALGGLLVPLIVKLIDVFNWQTTLIILGLTLWVICLPLSLLLRHKPEQYGYIPDGEESSVKVPSQIPALAISDADIETKQALKCRTFWHIGLATMLQHLAISTLMIHVMPYLSSVGISRPTASLIAMAVPLLSIIGRFLSGWLIDKIEKKLVAAAFFSISGLGMVSIIFASNKAIWLIIIFVIFFGIGWGSLNTLRTAMVREYFGRSKFGAIFGWMMGLAALSSIGGPLFAGWVFDAWASYQIAWIVLTFLVFIAVLLAVSTPPIITASVKNSV